jgi:hypothetical protein
MAARLTFEPYETRLVVLAGRKHATSTPQRRAVPLLTLDGDWRLQLGSETLTTPLRAWSDLGRAAYWGTGVYRKTFNLPAVPNDLTLDLGEVKYSARIRLNGQDLGHVPWRPFRWNIAGAARIGANDLVIEVVNTRANELAADQARYAEIEGRGWLKNSYIGMYLKFDREMVPSGLVGPVRIMSAK